MDYNNLENTTLNHTFFAPLEQVYDYSDKQYACTSISDLDFAKLGILRCLSKATTGNEFIQDHNLESAESYDVSHFFKALKSKRRLANLTSINSLLKSITKEHLPDAFAALRQIRMMEA